ncbi:hypothetical protein [Xenorhabdus innexi]|uniref:RING-type E3 ubiquitin transferase n=1 Tax=Xenorhabdus innexi TaxID=290109 RepID=A0A1N6MRJ2_9GAMM|nr:hypothetical protein [Xenorhabdus innexi]PHM38470.1 hypothetical protein Xinn_00167 [Xenorhabdus innexi]SIP71462.1 conserved membrane hypothetical protein [Xenorhabdus innexi]
MSSIIIMLIFSAVFIGITVFILSLIFNFQIKLKWMTITIAISSLLAGIFTYFNQDDFTYILVFFFTLPIFTIFFAKIWEFLCIIVSLRNDIKLGKKTVLTVIIQLILTILISIIGYFLNSLDSIVSFGFFAVFFATALILLWREKTPKKNFFKLQKILPTSKIGSMAMGLVEVQGKAIAEKQRLGTAPLSKKKCIAYLYTEHKKTKDREGKTYYKIIADKTYCAPFKIQDETGSVAVMTKDLSLVSLPPTHKYEKNNIRYEERAIFNHDTIMLIGAAAEKNISGKGNQIVIQKDIENNILAASPVESVADWNKRHPLVKSALTFAFSAVFLIAIILTIPYEYHDRTLTIMFNKSPLFSWLF